MAGTDGDDRLTTIRALLAKAEATTFPHEAEAFTAKATELMARYAIDESMIWATAKGTAAAGGAGSEPTEIGLELRRPYLPQKAVLVNEVAQVFGCRAIRWGSKQGSDVERVSLVGFPLELELVEALVTSLFVQLSTSMLGSQPAGLTSSQAASWRRSFIMGFTATATARLRADRSAAASGAGSTDRSGPDAARAAASSAGVAVALRERSAAVDAEFRRRHPFVRSTRVGVGSSAQGRNAGASAGERADLGHARVGSGRRALGAGRSR